MQSMSLQEILRRFVRKESLPISKEGVYEDRYDYDLEKLAKEDMTVQQEVLDEMKSKASVLEQKVKKEKADHQDAMKKAAAEKRRQLLEELKQDQANAVNSQGVNP